MTRRRGRALAVAVVVAAAVTLAGCASASPAPTATATGRAQQPQPTATVSGSGDNPTPAGDPTCDTIIPASTVDTFEKAGWVSREDPFFIGNIELPGGIQCTWGDAKVASDQVQVYGWAPITAEQVQEVTSELVDSGWKKFTENDVTYITATGDMILNADDQGYGMTYAFGDGHITFADTKQGLLLVEWPPAQ